MLGSRPRGEGSARGRPPGARHAGLPQGAGCPCRRHGHVRLRSPRKGAPGTRSHPVLRGFRCCSRWFPGNPGEGVIFRLAAAGGGLSGAWLLAAGQGCGPGGRVAPAGRSDACWDGRRATSGPVRDPRGCSSNSDATVNSTRLSISRASPFSGAQPRRVHLLTTPSSEFGVRWEAGASVSSAVTRQAHSAGFLRKGCFVTTRAVWKQECPGS